MNKIDIAALVVLFIVAFSLWTLPLQNDPRPFGEGDAAWHFSIGDYIASSDEPIWRLPFYIGLWYYSYNSILGPFAPEYPPPNHYNYALMQVAGGERFVPVIMYRAIASFLGIFAVYFLVSKLFGTYAAIIASSSLVFSIREQMIYLWGQQPTLISVVIAPVTFYAFYRYLDSYYKNNSKPVYLYVTAFLLGSQYLLHIQGFALSVLVLSPFTVLMFVKHRKLPFIKESKKHLAAITAIVLIIFLPFITIYLGAPDIGGSTPDYSRVFKWGIDPGIIAASYPSMYTLGKYSFFVLPLLLLGALFALLRRRNKDLLMLAWIAGLYLVLHVDLYLGVSQERSARLLISEAALFYSLMAVGIISLLSFALSFVKLPSNAKTIAKIGVTAIFVLIIFNGNNVDVSKDTLSASYQSLFRITPVQSEFADWLYENIPENAYLHYIPGGNEYKLGSWQYQKLRWILASSQRHVASGFSGKFSSNPYLEDDSFYFIFDYSDLVLLASAPNQMQEMARQSAQALQQYELDHFNISDALYNKNNIRVYSVETENFQ
ncbi:hypothetical protein CMO88_01030 [Candidatus Woesearchaeota archaeon]|nr:hypothetical protein [Candidatus Woesearchaeota archaeon]|tara:strand:+ start:1822 stop:3459 length:1638 start_codon:yes stop_codon:yes gene_type:complete